MKQTAVELLEDGINKVLSHLPLEREDIKTIIQQAKEMEKERIIKHSVELCKILISNPFETSGKRPQELIDSYFSKTFKSE